MTLYILCQTVYKCSFECIDICANIKTLCVPWWKLMWGKIPEV